MTPYENINIFTNCCACRRPLGEEGIRFPRNPELRNKWINIIMTHTPDYTGKRQLLDRNGLQLCVKHFLPQILIRKSEAGQLTYALRKGGYPSIFKTPRPNNGLFPASNGQPVDSTTNSEDEDISICYEMIPTTDVKNKSDSTEDPEVIVENTSNSASNQEGATTDIVLPDVPVPIIENGESGSICDVEMGEIATSTEPCQKDVIPSLQDFTQLLQQKNDRYYDPWRILYNDSSVVFLLLDPECKYLVQSFTVSENLSVSVFIHGQLFTDDGLTELMGKDLKLDSWTKFKKLILFLHNITKQKQNHTMKLRHACKLIQDCIDSADTVGIAEKEIKKWKFSLNQIEISDGQNKSYTPENLQWAMTTFMANKAGYAKIYESEYVTMPHPASLELYRKQLQTELLQKQLNARNKLPVVNPVKANLENGVPSPLQKVLPVVRNKIHVQPSSLNNSASTSAFPINSNVLLKPATSSPKASTTPTLQSSIDIIIDDDDVQEI